MAPPSVIMFLDIQKSVAWMHDALSRRGPNFIILLYLLLSNVSTITVICRLTKCLILSFVRNVDMDTA